MSDSLEQQAARLDEVILELERAIAHARIASRQFRDGEVPRACAHVIAVSGHLTRSSGMIQSACESHAVSALI